MSKLHSHIDDRAAFFRVLDETIAMNSSLRMGFGPTLEQMKQWTANGRDPTHEERGSVQMTGGLAHNYDGNGRNASDKVGPIPPRWRCAGHASRCSRSRSSSNSNWPPA